MDIVERLRQRIGLVKFDSDAIALHDAADEIERLRDEIYNLKLAVAGGEDAPGLANLVGLEDVIMWRKLWTDEIERLRGALKELLNVVPNFPSEGNVLIGMKERYKKALIEARAALKEKE